jgi:FKBP-type peptidyl-prolyl cis-trans isomerase FklB
LYKGPVLKKQAKNLFVFESGVKNILSLCMVPGKQLMKKIISLIAFFVTLGVSAQKPSLKNGSAAAPSISRLFKGTDSLQYLLGAFVGQWINANGFVLSNRALFNTALDNVLLNKTRAIPDSNISPLLTAYQEANQKNRAFTQEQQLFGTLKDKPGVGTFPSGVRYMVLKKGNGPRPTDADSIVINLIAKLPDGTIVEDTYQSKKPFAAKTNSFFPGMDEALQMMPEGSRWQLYIPAALAYGDKGTALIPPNSALVIEAELVAVKQFRK